jgi:prolyl oligopeptidase
MGLSTVDVWEALADFKKQYIMKNKLNSIVILVAICGQVHAQFQYPVARTEPFDTFIYNQKISDNYFWMSRPQHQAEMQDFCKQQDAFAKTILDSIPVPVWLEEDWGEAYAALDAELWGLSTVCNSLYYMRYVPDEGNWLCHRENISAPEEKILQRVEINGVKYAVKKRAYAHKKKHIALMLTQSGEANPQIRFYDISTKQFLPDSITPVMFNDSRGVSMTWMPDDSGLLYTQAPPTDKSDEIYYRGKIKLHLLGTPASSDKTIFGFGVNDGISLKEHETPYIYSFKNSPYLIARIRAGDRDNYAFAVHCSNLKGEKTPWVKLKDYINLSDGFDANGQYLYAVTKGEPRYRLVKIDLKTGNAPTTFIPQQDGVMAYSDTGFKSGVVAGKDVVYVLIRKVGDMQILKADYKTRTISYIPLPHKGSLADLSLLGENDLVFASLSPLKTAQYLHHDHKAGITKPLPFNEKFHDASSYLETKVLWVPSRDGKEIPVSLIYKKGLDLQNNNPLLIEAYGNGGASTDTYFDPTYQPWVKQGGIYAYAHVRGGGELGEEWMKDGQYPHKMNSIYDIEDIAAYFVKNNFTSPAKQLVMGGSAGSFLVGTSINHRPDLFAGGIFLSGLPDIVTYADAAMGREQSTVGLLGTKDGFLSAYSISSNYHIPKNTALPAMLIIHGATDYILGMHPAARYAANLQANQKGERPILLLINWEGGHSGGNNDPINIMKFAFWQTGHPDFQLN